VGLTILPLLVGLAGADLLTGLVTLAALTLNSSLAVLLGVLPLLVGGAGLGLLL